MKPILVTRPSPDGERTTAALAQVGCLPLHTPLMRITQRKAPLPPSARADALVFTSANGVRAWVQAGGSLTLPAFYVGPASAATGRALGLPITAIAQGDVDSLIPLITQAGVQRPLHVRGIHAVGDLVGRLTAKGLSPLSLPLYEASAVPVLPPLMVAVLRSGPCTVAFFSPRTARLFAELLAAAQADTGSNAAPPLIGAQTDALCLSPAVANVAKTLPFREIHAAFRPELSAFVDMAKARRT